MIGNILHNGALVVIMTEACLIYATVELVQDPGIALAGRHRRVLPAATGLLLPWPVLGDLLAASGTMVMLATYGTVIVQVAFPFTLFNRRLKNVLLAVMMVEHAVIAVVLGLPFFSLAMIATDAVFLPTPFLHRLGRWAARARGRLSSDGARTQAAEPRDQEKPEETRVGFTA